MKMPVFVRAVSMVVLVASSIGLAVGILELAVGDWGSEKVEGVLIIASSLIGELAAGVSWLVANISDVVVLAAKRHSIIADSDK